MDTWWPWGAARRDRCIYLSADGLRGPGSSSSWKWRKRFDEAESQQSRRIKLRWNSLFLFFFEHLEEKTDAKRPTPSMEMWHICCKQTGAIFMMDRYSVMFCGATGKPEDGQECKGDSSLTEDRILHGSTPQGPHSEGGNFLGAHPSGLYKSLPYSSGGHLGSRCKSPLFSKLNFLGPYTPQRSTFYYLTLQGPTPHFSSEPHSSGPHSLWFHSLEPFSLGAHSSGPTWGLKSGPTYQSPTL